MNFIKDISGTFLKIFKTAVLRAPQRVCNDFLTVLMVSYVCANQIF